MNLADDFFQKVFESDQSGGFAVFVQHDGNVKRSLAHLHKQFRDVFVFVCEISFPQDIFHMKFFRVVK